MAPMSRSGRPEPVRRASRSGTFYSRFRRYLRAAGLWPRPASTYSVTPRPSSGEMPESRSRMSARSSTTPASL